MKEESNGQLTLTDDTLIGAEKYLDDSKNTKVISSQSFLMDINALELPLFSFSKKETQYINMNFPQYEKTMNKTVESVNKKIIAENQKRISEGKPEKPLKPLYKIPKTPVFEKDIMWKDSNGETQSLNVFAPFGMVGQLEQDILFAIVKLLIEKHDNVEWDAEKQRYPFNNSVTFTYNELAKTMGVKFSGRTAYAIIMGLRRLRMTIYKTKTNTIVSANGENNKMRIEDEFQFFKRFRTVVIFKDGKEVEYDNRASVIELYSIKDVKKYEHTVEFGDIFHNNLCNEFFKFLSYTMMFNIKSGIPRRLYGYLEKNRYKHNGNRIQKLSIITRKFKTLKNKLPINSKQKADIISILQNAIQELVLKDYLSYETKIDTENESVIFIFKDNSKNNYKNIK